MADLTKSLLAAISAKLTTETKRGGALQDAQGFLVNYTSTGFPPTMTSRLPCILVDPLPLTAQAISIPPCMVQKQQPIQFTVIFDQGYHKGKGAADGLVLLNAIEEEFYLEGFGLAQWMEVTSTDYATPVPEPYNTPTNGAVSMVFTYIYTDMKSL